MLLRNKLLMVPGPTNIPNRVLEAMHRSIIYHRGEEFKDLYREIQDGLRYLFQTSNEVFVLSSSSSGGVECAIVNTISPGDKVLIVVNGVFSQRLRDVVEIYGGIPIELSVPWGKSISASDVEDLILKNMDIKAILIVHNETSTGVISPLAEIGDISDKYDKLLIVDAVSDLGGEEIKTDEWHVDICVAGTQKCLACPPGLALVSVSEKALDYVRNRSRPAFYFDLLRYIEYQKRMETPFTPAISLLFALREGLRLIKEEGLENRIERHQTCAEILRSGIKAMGLQMFSEEAFSNTVTVFKMPEKINPNEIRETLENRYGILIADGMGALKGKVLRIGTMGMISEPEIRFTLYALEKALNEQRACAIWTDHLNHP